MHMHMILGMFADISASIRHAARKVLCVMVLPNLEMFKFSIDSLLKNLEACPQLVEIMKPLQLIFWRNAFTRSCQEELQMIGDGGRLAITPALAFVSLYTCILRLFAF